MLNYLLVCTLEPYFFQIISFMKSVKLNVALLCSPIILTVIV